MITGLSLPMMVAAAEAVLGFPVPKFMADDPGVLYLHEQANAVIERADADNIDGARAAFDQLMLTIERRGRP